MAIDILVDKLKSAERRLGFILPQLSGVLSTELIKALDEIKFSINYLAPEEEKEVSSSFILFVDDEEIIRKIGTQILQREGYKVITAIDGMDALAKYKLNKDDVKCVILDLVMPKLDGMQTFRKLRKIAPDLGIILTTGYGENEIRKRFGGLKLQGFLRKPFSAVTLTEMVKSVIEAGEKSSNE